MEAAIYLADLLATLLLMYWAVRSADQPSGAPSTGLFAYRETLKPGAGKPGAGPQAGNAAAVLRRDGPPLPDMNGQPAAAPRGGWREPGRRDAGRRHPRRPDKAR